MRRACLLHYLALALGAAALAAGISSTPHEKSCSALGPQSCKGTDGATAAADDSDDAAAMMQLKSQPQEQTGILDSSPAEEEEVEVSRQASRGQGLRRRRRTAPTPASPYRVSVDGVPATLFSQPCQGDNMAEEHPCGNQTNNFVSHTLSASGTPVRIEVTSLLWTSELGDDVNIRPSHLRDTGVVSGIEVISTSKGKTIAFNISEPCQVSVEIGDEDLLFPDEDAYYRFADMLLFVNPPASAMPYQPPSLAENGCRSNEVGRTCVIASTDNSCDNLTLVPNQDLWFRHNGGEGLTYYQWADGCGDDPKKIMLLEGGRVFLDNNVVVYARILSTADSTGVYGYGIVSNQFMLGHKIIDTGNNVIDLQGPDSEVFGPVVLDSVYRNVQLGARGKFSFGKLLSWNMETDCVNMLSSGGRIRNSFFKANDDCLKAYQMDTVYNDNVIWHQDVGRALMFSWGNEGEAVNINGSVIFKDTFIIHDQLGFRRATVFPTSNTPLGLQAGMIYYSSLINAQHSPSNHIGTEESPVYIEDLYLESRVGSILLITNGYWSLDDKAAWMWRDGCTGPVFMRIKGLDMSRVTGQAAPSVVGGCDLDEVVPGIANANCLCTTKLGCTTTDCHVGIIIENVIPPLSSNVSTLKDTLVVGNNAVVTWD